MSDSCAGSERKLCVERRNYLKPAFLLNGLYTTTIKKKKKKI